MKLPGPEPRVARGYDRTVPRPPLRGHFQSFRATQAPGLTQSTIARAIRERRARLVSLCQRLPACLKAWLRNRTTVRRRERGAGMVELVCSTTHKRSARMPVDGPPGHKQIQCLTVACSFGKYGLSPTHAKMQANEHAHPARAMILLRRDLRGVATLSSGSPAECSLDLIPSPTGRNTDNLAFAILLRGRH